MGTTVRIVDGVVVGYDVGLEGKDDGSDVGLVGTDYGSDEGVAVGRSVG